MKDLRDWIQVCEQEGELQRIKVEVDWNLELSHIARLNEGKKGPALLFEKVKGYDTPVLASLYHPQKARHHFRRAHQLFDVWHGA